MSGLKIDHDTNIIRYSDAREAIMTTLESDPKPNYTQYMMLLLAAKAESEYFLRLEKHMRQTFKLSNLFPSIKTECAKG